MKSNDFNDSFLDNDSMSINDILKLHRRIEMLQYQNEVNAQQLCELECKDEKKRKMLIENKK